MTEQEKKRESVRVSVCVRRSSISLSSLFRLFTFTRSYFYVDDAKNKNSQIFTQNKTKMKEKSTN